MRLMLLAAKANGGWKHTPDRVIVGRIGKVLPSELVVGEQAVAEAWRSRARSVETPVWLQHAPPRKCSSNSSVTAHLD
jgi:hypothetical protein